MRIDRALETHILQKGQLSTSRRLETHILQKGIRNRTEPAEPNLTESIYQPISEPAGTGRRNEPNRTGPSHDASEKRRPNRVESGNYFFRTKPNRTDDLSKSPEPKRIEPNRFVPDIPGNADIRPVFKNSTRKNEPSPWEI